MQFPISTSAIPLYIQIRDLFVTKISNKEWMPGDMIPSEVQLAKTYNISQGTVRKAIIGLVNSNVLMRKQGKGTFVTSYNIHRTLFHFFHIVDDESNKIIPQSVTLSCVVRKATNAEITKLNLRKKSRVICIDRTRTLNEQAIILETIILPAKLFSAIKTDKNTELPNMLYGFYESHFSITIHSVREKLRAISASKHEASLLNIPIKTPLLEIERLAITLDKKPVELRISRCHTKHHHYENTIF